MTKRNFVVTVKEREAGGPCFFVFEAYDDIGLGDKQVTLYLPIGTSIEEAEALAKSLNAGVAKIAETSCLPLIVCSLWRFKTVTAS